MSSPVHLQITDIIWYPSSINMDDLPKKLELQWNNGRWKNAEVSKYLSNYYNASIISLKIRQLANKTTSG